MMSDAAPQNPYAAPVSAETPIAREELARFEALKSAGIGLGLVYTGLLLFVLCAVGAVALVGAAAGQTWVRGWTAVIPLLLFGGFLCGSLLSFSGGIFCCPPSVQLRSLGVVLFSIVLQGLLILSVVRLLFVNRGPAGGVSRATGGVESLIMLASVACFVIFLRRASHHIERPDLAARGRNVLIGELLIVLTATPFHLVTTRPNDSAIAVVSAMMTGLGGVAIFLMYANLVNALGKAIRNPHLQPPENHLG